ncbi:polysaccharide deacetylase family protein [Chloroflexota bacterium]
MKKQLDTAIFMISVDVELLWGYVLYPTKNTITALRSDPSSGRDSFEQLLGIFEKYNIPATWAFVGHLFLDHCDKEDGIVHKNMPRFKDDWYSIDPGTDIISAPLYYGKDIVEKILSSPIKHEIGYHSFSHVPFSECSRQVAEAEIRAGVELAKEFGVNLKSFVFPENKVGHVDVLKENGFNAYRVFGSWSQKHGDASPNSLTRRINAVIKGLMPPSSTELKRLDGICETQASMHFGDAPLLELFLVPRAKLGVYRAIKTKSIFHIFLHSHSLLVSPSPANKLERFLKFVSKKREEGVLEVMTMDDLASRSNED